jgi:hypothetical protein
MCNRSLRLLYVFMLNLMFLLKLYSVTVLNEEIWWLEYKAIIKNVVNENGQIGYSKFKWHRKDKHVSPSLGGLAGLIHLFLPKSSTQSDAAYQYCTFIPHMYVSHYLIVMCIDSPSKCKLNKN